MKKTEDRLDIEIALISLNWESALKHVCNTKMPFLTSIHAPPIFNPTLHRSCWIVEGIDSTAGP